MKKQFQRTIENFTCGHCGQSVTGNGYTNHCPHCLYSRHVDINPGDRAATCCALMAPVAVSQKRDDFFLLHRCTQCGFERPNRSAPEDSFDALLALSRQQATGGQGTGRRTGVRRGAGRYAGGP